jgi:hypothetical protein
MVLDLEQMVLSIIGRISDNEDSECWVSENILDPPTNGDKGALEM